MIIIISAITVTLTLFYVAGVFYFRSGWLKVEHFSPERISPKTRVTVLIAARNEEDNIDRTIRALIKQNYPKNLLEIIIVDDHSTDHTASIISGYINQGVRLLKLSETAILNSYKKKAISEGVKLATGELLVTTDADCYMSPDWLSTIVSFYEQFGWKLISSPVTFFEEKKKFEKLQTVEFLYLIGLGAASIGNKMPATCNGANLAYTKQVFTELKGFQGIDDLASGDDELFMHKVASAYPSSIGFCKSVDAIVYTHAKSNLPEFIRQRKRWASKSTKYKNKSIVALGVLIWLFNLLIFINIIAGIFFPEYLLIALFSLISKFLVEMLFINLMLTFIGRTNLVRYVPILTVIHIVYMIYIGIAGNSGKYIWKGRKVK